MAKQRADLWSDEFYWAVDPRVVTAGYQQAPPGWTMTPKRPLVEDFDLWYIAGGRGAVRVDGRWIAFVPGDLVTIKPGQRYQEERADEADPFSLTYVHVLPFGADALGLGRPLARRWPSKLPLGHQPRLGPLFAELFDTFTARPEGHALRLKALMLQILDVVFASLRHHAGSRLPPAYPKLLRARDYLVRHNRRDLTLDEVAEHADLSASYLSALFKRHLGCSPMQYQTRVRLRNAKRLLARGLTVTEAAEEAGFHSLHYFSRTFRRHHGQTPSAFAELCRRK